MKKIYLGLSAALLASTVVAQKSIVKRASGFQNFTTEFVKGKPGIGQEKVGTTIWSDDFSTSGNWTINNNGQAAPDFGWAIGTTSNAWYGLGAINSTSGGEFAELNNGDPTASPATQALNVVYTMTTTSAIDVMALGGTDKVSLQYMQSGAHFYDAQEVYVSVDGVNWVLVDDNSDKGLLSASGGSAYTNPTTEFINISPFIAGNASSVWIRFSWTTEVPSQASDPNVWVTYGWQIDDVAIITNESNNNTLDVATMGMGAQQLPYTLITPTQASDVSFSANVTNNGAADQPNTALEVTTGGNTYSSAAGNLLVSGTSDSLVTTTMFNTGATLATYTMNYEIVSDSIDSDLSDNVATKTIQVTQNIFGRDEAGINGSNVTGGISNSVSNSGQTIRVGNIMDVMADQTVYAIDAKYTGSVPTSGSTIYCELYKWDGSTYVLLESTNEIDVTLDSEISGMITFVLTNPVNLIAGDDIFVAAGHYGSEISIATSGPGNGGALIIDANGGLGSFADQENAVVRLNFDNSIGIKEVKEAGIRLGQNMPNPFNENSTIKFSIETAAVVDFTITDMTGKIVEVKQLGNLSAGNHTITIDAANYNSGMYFYTMTAGNYSVSSKMTIQK